MRLVAFSLSFLLAEQAVAAELQAFRVRREPVAWLVAADRYNEPSTQWVSGSEFMVQLVTMETGTSAVRESGASVSVSGPSLSLTFPLCPVKRAADQPIPAVAIPVILEWRVTDLPKGEYLVSVRPACK